MPTVTRKINVSCSLAEAWEVLSDFGEISIWATNVSHSCLLSHHQEGLGATRRIQTGNSSVTEHVTSPTFALAQHYKGIAGKLTHLDLYRLEIPASADEVFCQEEEEAEEIGAMIVVEWPERLSFNPQIHWKVYLELLDKNKPELGRLAIIKY